jgi:hypothetical protein
MVTWNAYNTGPDSEVLIGDYEQNAYKLSQGKEAIQRLRLQRVSFQRRRWHGSGANGRAKGSASSNHLALGEGTGNHLLRG